MARSTPKLTAKEPKNVFFKPLKADFKDLFKALAKGIGHTAVGKWEELGSDTVEALSSIGLSTDPGELAFLLIRRSITRALFDLVGESVSQYLAETKRDEASIIEQLDTTLAVSEIKIDRSFLDRPSELEPITWIQELLSQWLRAHGVAVPAASAITERFPSYFTYALNQEWRRNAKAYAPLLEVVDTPFTKAGEREWAWSSYSALLQRRVQESIFDEPFGLKQIFVEPNAYYTEDPPQGGAIENSGMADKSKQRHVISLTGELEQWLLNSDSSDAIRVVSGGPGSGKSSFARIFAAKVAEKERMKALFVPLHLIDASKDLAEEVGRFVKDEGVLAQNPLDPESPEPNLLIIFDGLDELASQGKAAAETARAFVREVEKTVERRNLHKFKLRVLISGREMVVQENESEFRRARQVLTLLPYFTPPVPDDQTRAGRAEERYVDPKNLLGNDLRDHWWRNYGALTGKGYAGLPPELHRPDLDEITSQPLLNYLVALSLTREPLHSERPKLDFTGDVNLNLIYADLVVAVHERGYEKHRPYGPIRHMSLQDFFRVLEEVGLAAWHGDGRSTTVREIEEHCRASGVGRLLDVFQEGAQAGVTRLLAAFFFRQHGQRPSGDPTFVFTHKSFGEYLAARRIVRAVERLSRELDSHVGSPDEGWDERDALKHWALVCGPSPVSQYLHTFLLKETALRAGELPQWQNRLVELFCYTLRYGLPMEQIQVRTFGEAWVQSRNAEEALLVVLNACARATRRLSEIPFPDPLAFGTWFRGIQGQRSGPQSAFVAASCLSFLDLSNSLLDISDFYGADLSHSKLELVQAHYSVFGRADLRNADLRNSTLSGAYLGGSQLQGARLDNVRLDDARLEYADLTGASFAGAQLREANLRHADLSGADFTRADLSGADLRQANLAGADLRSANLKGAKFEKAELAKAKTEGLIDKKRRMLPADGRLPLPEGQD
jgi:uncharacterized protein YjbI with pentapeptide repeats